MEKRPIIERSLLIIATSYLLIRMDQKTLVSFEKEPYKRDVILQKRPIFERSLLIVATPYLLTRMDQTTCPRASCVT